MDISDSIVTGSAEETSRFGSTLARDLVHLGQGSTARVLCLYGNLGSGKTTFTQGFARELGIHARLLSPTFIIVRRYTIPNSEEQLFHIDLYRLEESAVTDELGLSEILSDPAAYVVIEWAEKLADLLPSKRIDIHFSVDTDGKHRIFMQHYGKH